MEVSHFMETLLMTPRQIDLVQQTFAQVKPIASAAAEMFYARLFQLDPSGRLNLQTQSMENRGKSIVAFIGTKKATHQVIDMIIA